MLLRKYFRGVKIKHGNFEKLNIFDKTIFKLLYFIILAIKPRKKTSFYIEKNSINNVLVLRPGGIGDTLLTIPFFRELKKNMPGVKIDVIASKRNKKTLEFLSNEFEFKNIFLIEKDLCRFTKKKYDVVFNLDQSKYEYITPVVTSLIKSKFKVGYDIRSRAKLYTHKTVFKHEEYEAQCMLNQLAFLRINKKFQSEDLLLKKVLLKDSLKKFELKESFIALGLGCLNPQNRLPEKTIKEIIEYLGVTGKQIVFFGSENEYSYIDKLKKGVKGDFFNLSGKTSLKETLSLLSHAKLFFGYDGGTLHMAVASGCPTISVWGPSLFEKWFPRGKSHKFIKKDLPCQPCVYGRFPVFKKCPYNKNCLNDMNKSEIINELKELL